jgi:hypothetical protein
VTPTAGIPRAAIRSRGIHALQPVTGAPSGEGAYMKATVSTAPASTAAPVTLAHSCGRSTS